MNTKKTLSLNNDNFDALVRRSDQPVLVDFYADWCPPCRAIAPAVEELSVQFEGQAKVGKVDIEASSELASEFGIHSIPSLLIFKDGQEVERIQGAVPKEVLAEKLAGVS